MSTALVPDPLPAWLAAQRAAYRAEPDCAADLLPALIAAGSATPSLPLTLLAAELALECRNPSAVEDLLLPQLQGHPAPAIEAELRSHLARSLIQQLRFDAAREQLEVAQTLATQAPLAQALILASRAQLAHREDSMAEAAGLAAQALQAFAALAWDGPWVQAYSTRAVALRELGDRPGRAATLREGCSLATAQRRWGEAANLATGLFDMALEDGRLAQAEQLLLEAEALAARERAGSQAPGHAMVTFSRARWLAAQGRHVEACAGLREALDQQKHRLVRYEYALRLDQLADWLVLAGQPLQALETALEAQQVQRQLNEQAHQRSHQQLRQHLAVEQAERERQQSEAHALQLEAQQGELARALQRQHELHDELVEARKLAGLGQLLTGLSRSLQAPLQAAQETLQHSTENEARMLERVGADQPLSRKELREALQASRSACAGAQRHLEQALAEVSTYQSLRDEAA